MGIGDSIRGAVSDAIGASSINKALTPAPAPKAQTGDFPRSSAGHVTSGLDQAMRDHADKVHPVSKAEYGAVWDK